MGDTNMRIRWLKKETPKTEKDYLGFVHHFILIEKVLQYYDEDTSAWRDVPEVEASE
jgi:hypothetical protein